jgi:hypothetical protein
MESMFCEKSTAVISFALGVKEIARGANGSESQDMTENVYAWERRRLAGSNDE